MPVEQLLFGYREGHRLIAGSVELDAEVIWGLIRNTDRPSTKSENLLSGITFGYPLNERFYALFRTWSALEISRPGAVWTHVLLIPKVFSSPLSFIDLFRKPVRADFSSYKKSIDVSNNIIDVNSSIPLSDESARLLLLISSKSRSDVKVICRDDPLRVLNSASNFCSDILTKRYFSTDAGKISKKIPGIESFIISQDSALLEDKGGWVSIASNDISLPSKRIDYAWNRLNRDAEFCARWLAYSMDNLTKTSTNLKISFEALNLGAGTLDDFKFLARLSKLYEQNQAENIFKFTGGCDFHEIDSPASITACYLLTIDEWGPWEQFFSSEVVGEVAAMASGQTIAKALEDYCATPINKIALRRLATSIGESKFIEIYNESDIAAQKLIKNNRELLFFISKPKGNELDYAAAAAQSIDSSISRDLDYLNIVPFFWKNLTEKAIRYYRNEDEFINYSLSLMQTDSWNVVSDASRKFLKSTNNFKKNILLSSLSEEVVRCLISEFGKQAVLAEIIGLVNSKKIEINQAVEVLLGCIDPADEIPALVLLSTDIRNIFIAELSSLRWRISKRPEVYRQILKDISGLVNFEEALGLLKSKKLSSKLESDLIKTE